MKKIFGIFICFICLLAIFTPSQSEAYAITPDIPPHADNLSEIGLNLSAEELTKPLPAELYYGRTLLTDEGKKAWDYAVEVLLSYDNSDNAYPKDGSGNTYLTINYALEADAYPTAEDVKRIQSYLVRNEPRLFHLKDWGASFNVNSEGETVQTFYIGNGVQNGNDYLKKLEEIEPIVSAMLAKLKADMTIYQQVRLLQSELENHITYSFDGANSDIRGAFIGRKAICGGYSKAFMYLMQRINLNCIWLEGYTAPNGGGYHAWNYVEIFGNWYMVDTTWGGDNWYLQGQNYREDGFAMHDPNPTFAVIPTLAEDRVPANYGKYPSITLDVEENAVVLQGEDFDPKELVTSFSSVYNEDLSGNITVKTQLDTDETGVYETKFILSDAHGNSVEKTATIKVAEGQRTSCEAETYPTAYTLLQKGNEVPYTEGFLFKEHDNPPRTFAVPSGENVYFEATVGIIGSVRQNTSFGHYAGVEFLAEFLDEEGAVVGSYKTARHGWKTEAENLFVEIPDGATSVRINSLAVGSGNNHSFWANAGFTVYKDPSDLTLIPAEKVEIPESPDGESETPTEEGTETQPSQNGEKEPVAPRGNKTVQIIVFSVVMVLAAGAVIFAVLLKKRLKSGQKGTEE